MHPILRYLVFGALTVFGLFVIGYVWIVRAYDEDFSRFFTPASIAEAAEHGVLVREVEVAEASTTGDAPPPRVREAWVHAQSHAEWRWLLFRRVVLDEGRFLCFTLEGDSLDPFAEVANKRYAWTDEAGKSFSPEWRSGSPIVWCRETEGDAPQTLRVTRVDTRPNSAVGPQILEPAPASLRQ